MSFAEQKISVDIIGKSTEIKDYNPQELQKEMMVMGGKAAGICYMPDDYLSIGIQDEEKAALRAQGNCKSGHYSVFEHGHINMILKIPKIIAMILNSMGLYATSEKSARYTLMKPETDLEDKLYRKWTTDLKQVIKEYFSNSDEELIEPRQIEKLAMENARYMISVFTPTTMEYTIPFNRYILTCEWLDDFYNATMEDLEFIYKDDNGRFRINFYERVAVYCHELAKQMREALALDKDNPILVDHKLYGIEFFDWYRIYKKIGLKDYRNMYNLKPLDEVYGNMYISHYEASFAEVAQAQRHRTLKYYVSLPSKDDIRCVIPPIISNNYFINKEWIKDMMSLVEEGIVPQGLSLNVTECGRFEDFVIKCKERLCSRAQLEICQITGDQVEQFLYNYKNLSRDNQLLLDNITQNQRTIIPRCMFKGYTCKEPCKMIKEYKEKMIDDRII